MPLLGNEFTTGGLTLMVVGAVMALLRQIPARLYGWLVQRFTVSVVIVDSDPLFEWAKLWLDSLPYSKKSRSITASLQRQDEEDFSADSRMLFTPAYGDHYFRHGRHWLKLSVNKNEAPTSNGGVRSAKAPESITITILGSKQSAARELIAEIVASARNIQQQQLRGYISGCGWWRRLMTFRPRQMETVDLPTEDERLIVSAIRRFQSARAEYARRGIPYHLNFLFAGLPGTGKTSLASALCGHFGLNLCLLNIAGPGMNDDRLIDLMLSLPRRSMLLLEDVDAVVPERKAKPKAVQPTQGDTPTEKAEAEGITLSGLLNCMDGLTAPDGAVIVMTTNHPELLDPALLRPGRVDVRVDFQPATRSQIEKMCQRLNPSLSLNGNVEAMLARQLTTAQVQAELLSLEAHS